MEATITFILSPTISHINKGEYFVIKMVTDDGKKYDIVPSSDCVTYQDWKEICSHYGIGARLFGLKHLMTKNGKNFFNKKVLPLKII